MRKNQPNWFLARKQGILECHFSWFLSATTLLQKWALCFASRLIPYSYVPNSPNVFGRLPLSLFRLCLLQESFSAQPDYLGFGFPPLPGGGKWWSIPFSSPPIFVPLYFPFKSQFDYRVSVKYKFLLMVQMHCKIPGRLNLLWRKFCASPWTG